MKIEVRNGDVNSAIKVLKKKVMKDGMLKELREREYYESKGTKRRKAKEAATRRYKRKRAKENAQRTRLY